MKHNRFISSLIFLILVCSGFSSIANASSVISFSELSSYRQSETFSKNQAYYSQGHKNSSQLPLYFEKIVVEEEEENTDCKDDFSFVGSYSSLYSSFPIAGSMHANAAALHFFCCPKQPAYILFCSLEIPYRKS
jgi:hypothetical protein